MGVLIDTTLVSYDALRQSVSLVVYGLLFFKHANQSDVDICRIIASQDVGQKGRLDLHLYLQSSVEPSNQRKGSIDGLGGRNPVLSPFLDNHVSRHSKCC